MEFPNIGKQCEIESCTRLDFLPFQCDNCGKTLCMDHKSCLKHECCVKDRILLSHELPPKIATFQCSLADCKIGELVPNPCKSCDQNHCLGHRHPQDHFCKSIVATIPMENEQNNKHMTAEKQEALEKLKSHLETQKQPDVKTILNNCAAKPRKNDKIADKTTLMVLKLKAVGDKNIASLEKLYLRLNLPTGLKYEGKEKLVPVFVNKVWTIGRCVDSICKILNISNNNEKFGDKNLCLFFNDEQFVMDIHMNKLMESHAICDGSIVDLKFES